MTMVTRMARISLRIEVVPLPCLGGQTASAGQRSLSPDSLAQLESGPTAADCIYEGQCAPRCIGEAPLNWVANYHGQVLRQVDA